MKNSLVVIQKDRTRYSFRVSYPDFGNSSPVYCIETEQLCKSGLGSSLFYRYVKKEEGNSFYKEMMAKGFKRFRKLSEVSWYATTENNTPWEEEWKTERGYLIPVKSRVLTKE